MPEPKTCDGCGACCMQQESPPMYLSFLTGVLPDDPQDEDAIRVRALPDELKRELLAYGEHIGKGNPHPRGGVCLWFDESTRGCRHYERRPSICREFEIGSPACVGWREEYMIV